MPMARVTAADNEVIVESYSTSKDTIAEGTEFNLDITFKNLTGADITNASLNINPGSFILKNTGSVIQVDIIPATGTKKIRLPLKCTGTNNVIQLTLNYNSGKTSVNNITIDMIKPDTNPSPTTPTNTQKYNPELTVMNQTMPTVTAGSKLNLKLEVENLSTHRAKNISVELVPPSDGFYYESTNMSMINYIKELKSKGKATLDYSLLVQSGTKAKTYMFQLRYKYQNAYGDDKTKTQDIYVKVKQGIPDIKLGINQIKTLPENVYPGQETELSFMVNNNSGMSYVKSIEASLKGLSQTGFSINSGVNSQTINNLSPAIDGKLITFKIHASEKMEAGNHPLTVVLKYQDSQNNTQTLEKEIYIKVNKKNEAPLEILNIVTVPTVMDSGKEGKFQFTIKSKSSTDINNVKVSLKGLSAQGINLVEGVNNQTIPSLKANSTKNLAFQIYTADNLAKGSYPLTIKLTYKDAHQVEQTLEREVYIRVDKKIADIAIEKVVAPGSVTNDQTFGVSFNLVNRSSIAAKDITVTVKPTDQIVPVSQNVHTISSLPAGGSKKLNFNFQATAEATTKSYMLNIEVKGKNENELATINQYVGVYVDKGNALGKPNIIVDSYETVPTIVNAGKNFELNISLNNTHKSKKVQNIKVFLTAQEENTAKDSSKTGSVFTPVNSSNTFFIDDIAPKTSVSKKLTLYTIPYASAKTHTIKVNLEYEDEKGTAYTATELISVPVIQESSFITSDINIPETMVVKQPHSLNLEISNTGKTTLDNFTVLVEGFGASNTRGYIGNLTSGSTTYHKVDVWPLEEGEAKGAIIFTYTKPDGEVEKVRKEITTKATGDAITTSGESLEGYMNQGTDVEAGIGLSGGGFSFVKIVIIAIVIIVVLIVVVRIIKKKKGQNNHE